MATVTPEREEQKNTTKSEKALKKDRWKADYKAWKPEQENEGRDWEPGESGVDEKTGKRWEKKERVFPFYLISTLEVNAINTHNADIEIYMKIHWRFNDLAGAIGRDQIEFYSPEGGGDGTDPELLTGEMLDTGIPNGTLVRGGLPRRKHGKRGDGKGLAVDPIETRYDDKRSRNYYYNPVNQKTGWTREDVMDGAPPTTDPPAAAEKQGQLFHAELPFNVMRPFNNQFGGVKHLTPCWSAYDKDKQVLSCQVHLSLSIKVPNSDLASYPIDRRIIPLVVARRSDKNFENGWTFSTKLVTVRPNWVKFSYKEDNSVLSVKWPDSASSRALPLDLRSHQKELEFTEVKDEAGKAKKDVNGEKIMKETGRKIDQGVFVYEGNHLLVLMERDPRNFLWNVVLPNWILVFASHATMFMEVSLWLKSSAGRQLSVRLQLAADTRACHRLYADPLSLSFSLSQFYIETGDQGDNNKSLLGEQIGVGLGVILAVMANKFVALQQELPKGLPFNTMADYYFVLSFFWVSVLMSINTALFCCVTRWNWIPLANEIPVMDAGGKSPTLDADGKSIFRNDPNIDIISSFIGIAFAVSWSIVNVFFAHQALKGGWFSCTKRTPWKKVVDDTTAEQVDSYTEYEDEHFVTKETGLLDPKKVKNLDLKKVK